MSNVKPKVGRRRANKKPVPCGNFLIAINGTVKGGWANTSPDRLRDRINEIETECKANNIDMSISGVEAIIDRIVADGDVDEAEAALIAYWLAHKDPEWKKMMQHFGRGIDFKVDVTNATGQTTATVYVQPTPGGTGGDNPTNAN